MAITYFALTATVPEMCEVNDVVRAKLRGQIRVWVNTDPPTPTDKWLIVGDDIAQNDMPGLRTISPSERNAVLNETQRVFGMSRADIAQYGQGLGRGFHMDIHLSQNLADSL